MSVKKYVLKKVAKSDLCTFKIRNRRGYAVICKDNLTEGATTQMALARMNKVLKRIGYTIG